MVDEVSLDPQRLDAALAVLRREQAAYLPSPRQSKLYRAFNVSAFSTVAAAVLALLVSTFGMQGDTGLLLVVILGFLILAAAVFAIATLVLFVLNWGLIRKLHRHARLRRRLKLAFYFAPAFSEERRQTLLGNVVTMVITAFGVLLGLAGVLGVALSMLLRLASPPPSPFVSLMFLFLSVAVLGVGVGLASLHFVRRGKQRLEVVLRLQQTLARQTADPAHAATVMVSAEEYDAIAGLEREHIIRDRTSSIILGRKEAAASTYLCQASRQMNDAKSKLPPDVLAKVEGTITALLADPAQGSAVDDPTTGTRILPVAGTPLKIQFDVDQTRHLVRLRDLDGVGS